MNGSTLCRPWDGRVSVPVKRLPSIQHQKQESELLLGRAAEAFTFQFLFLPRKCKLLVFYGPKLRKLIGAVPIYSPTKPPKNKNHWSRDDVPLICWTSLSPMWKTWTKLWSRPMFDQLKKHIICSNWECPSLTGHCHNRSLTMWSDSLAPIPLSIPFPFPRMSLSAEQRYMHAIHASSVDPSRSTCSASSSWKGVILLGWTNWDRHTQLALMGASSSWLTR